MRDSFQREINYLRVSVTDMCNFRCSYCMPKEGIEAKSRSEILSLEELYHVIHTFVEKGVTKVRLTGGEPLLRKSLIFLIESIKKIEKISKNDDKFTIICDCEDDKLVIEANKSDNKLTNLKLNLGSTMVNHKKLKEDNQAFIDKSYHIVDSLREGKKEEFKKDVEGLNQTPEKFDEMYEGLAGDLKLMGNILEKEAEVDVIYANEFVENGPVNENLVKVSLIYKFENIDKVIYNVVYREDLSLVSLEVTSDD